MNLFRILRISDTHLEAIARDPKEVAKVLRALLIALLGVIVTGVVIAAAFGIAFASARANDHHTAKVVEEIRVSRLANAKGGCLKDNAIRRAAGLAARRKAQDFVKLQYEALGTSFEQQSPKIKELTLRFFNEQQQVTLDSYPHRDCSSPAAIDSFNKHQPPDTESCVHVPFGRCADAPTTTTTSSTTTTTVP